MNKIELGKNVRACMNDYGMTGDSEWSNNILSTKAVRGPSGRLGRGDEVLGTPALDELELCEKLSSAAAKVAPDLEVGMGSEGSERFEAFFVSANPAWHCSALGPDAIRSAFGSALYPATEITVEALNEGAKWWQSVVEGGAPEESLDAWRRLIDWFQQQKDFVEVGFVAVNKEEEEIEGGCVLPRLLLGRTAKGSIAGLFGVVVYT